MRNKASEAFVGLGEQMIYTIDLLRHIQFIHLLKYANNHAQVFEIRSEKIMQCAPHNWYLPLNDGLHVCRF